MTAVVRRERAGATGLTAVAGLVIVAASLVMMACSAPSLAHPRPQGAPARTASVHIWSPRTGSWPAGRAGRAGERGRAAGPAGRGW
jgi:hypothetical protein